MPDIGLSAEWIRDQFMKLTALCERIVTTQAEQDRRIEKIEGKVDEIRDKPGKRWDTAVTAILTTIIGILIGLFFAVPKV